MSGNKRSSRRRSGRTGTLCHGHPEGGPGIAPEDSSKLRRGINRGTAAHGPYAKITFVQRSSHDELRFLPQQWQLLRDSAHSAPWNMAADETLLHMVRGRSAGILRLYSWSSASISFGRNEVVKGRFDPQALAASGFDVVRRPTGGRALLHIKEVTYSVTVPLGSTVGWRSVYDGINKLLCDALRSLGVDARIVSDNEGVVITPSKALCFSAPSAGELVAGGAKLVASAVWRDRAAFLQQGSIIVDGDQEPLRALGGIDDSLVGQVARLSDFHVPTDFDTVADAISKAFAKNANVTEMDDIEEVQRLTASRVHHYRDPSWLWRR